MDFGTFYTTYHDPIIAILGAILFLSVIRFIVLIWQGIIHFVRKNQLW